MQKWKAVTCEYCGVEHRKGVDVVLGGVCVDRGRCSGRLKRWADGIWARYEKMWAAVHGNKLAQKVWWLERMHQNSNEGYAEYEKWKAEVDAKVKRPRKPRA